MTNQKIQFHNGNKNPFGRSIFVNAAQFENAIMIIIVIRDTFPTLSF